jgi:hypothetical protein
MTAQLEVDELVALLLDEHKYGNSLSPKAVHKILYIAKEELERERVSVNLSTFWYMYGPVAAIAGTGVAFGAGAESRVACDVEVPEIDAPDGVRRRGQRAVSRALDQYYDHGLEGLTDRIYEDAPYKVQRHYRRLDKQLGAAADEGQMTLDGRKNEKRTRETLFDFVESFPVGDFPEYEDDLHIWYRLMSAQLDSDDYDPSRAQRLAEMFWRLFCLELASRENDGLSREEIAEELNIERVAAEKQRIRSTLLSHEREKARNNARDSEEARKAAEAFVVPYLNFEVTA